MAPKQLRRGLNIGDTDALLQAGYKTKTKDAAMVMASKLTNPNANPGTIQVRRQQDRRR